MARHRGRARVTPDAEWLAQWEADEAESARARTAELNRLQADLDAFPDSPTLNTPVSYTHLTLPTNREV